MSKKTLVIAGPNGAGRATFARSLLPKEANFPRFISADLIASVRAMKRAAKVARRGVIQAGTAIVILRNKKVVRVTAKQLSREIAG